MRAYATNVLPTDAAYYTLVNATMANNQLHILAGGSAIINLTPAQLAALTEYFRVTATMTPSSGVYSGGTYIIVKMLSVSGKYISNFCNVVTNMSGIFSTELEAIAENYTFLQVIIQSATECTFTSWGLEPEVSAGDVQVEINGVKQSLPKLLYDYNTTVITVGLTEQLVGMISCYLMANTDLQGHFLMNVNALERCTAYLRFYDNNMEELFSPLLYTINAGLTSITVPHAYLSKLVGIHNFTVTAQVTNGSLSIPTRSVLYTIDGGYLAKRLLNPGIDVQDIAIQQLATDSTPSSVYAIGTDNNIITIKKHVYVPEKANEAWEAVYTLGEGVVAALEFNGTWNRRTGNHFFTLECEDVPWAFWTNPTGTLYGQRGAVDTTKVTLAAGVSYVKAIRGYKSELYTDQDQGLVVVYLKNGVAYYRNYCRQADESVVWEEERVLTQLGIGLTSVQIHRLNDYRLGFVGSSPSGNKWLITERTYIGAAFPPETFSFSPDSMLSMAISPVNSAEHSFHITTEVANNHIDLYINCDVPLFVRKDFNISFEISSTTALSIKSMDTYGTRLHITLTEAVNSSILTLVPIGDNVVAVFTNCGYIHVTESIVIEIVGRGYENETFSFAPAVNLTIAQKYLATYYGYFIDNFKFTPTLSAASLVQKALITSYGYNLEEFKFTISIPSWTMAVSFVGTEPV